MQVARGSLDEIHRELLEAHARLELRWPVRLQTVVMHLSFAHYVLLTCLHVHQSTRFIGGSHQTRRAEQFVTHVFL